MCHTYTLYIRSIDIMSNSCLFPVNRLYIVYFICAGKILWNKNYVTVSIALRRERNDKSDLQNKYMQDSDRLLYLIILIFNFFKTFKKVVYCIINKINFPYLKKKNNSKISEKSRSKYLQVAFSILSFEKWT